MFISFSLVQCFVNKFERGFSFMEELVESETYGCIMGIQIHKLVINISKLV